MIFDWYKIINYTEFVEAGLPSQELEVFLQDVGVKTILVTKGNMLGILYDGVYLGLNLNDKNPFSFEGYGIYIDDNEDVWLGIEVEE